MSIPWIAGVFEGEGYIRTYDSNSYEVVVKMCDLDILERIQQECGGSITPYSPTNRKHTLIFCWRLTKKSHVRNFLSSILPYLGYRRTYAAQNLLDAIDLK